VPREGFAYPYPVHMFVIQAEGLEGAVLQFLHDGR
jgi:hypothetical protein